MSSKTFLVVGCGSMGRRRIRHAASVPGASVIGWDIRADRRREVEEQFHIRTVASERDIDDLDLAAIFICVPPADHEHYIFKALERRLAFMVEQPISFKADRLDEIFDQVSRANVVCHVSSNQRYSPRVRTMKRVLDEGRLGRPLTGLVELGEWLPDWHPYEPYTDYYPSRRAMGGGLDIICDLDWLRFLFGDVVNARSLCSKKSELDIDTDDVVQALLDFGKGPQLAVHCDMLQRPFHRQSRFVLSNGLIVHNHPDQKLRVYQADTRVWEEISFDVDLSSLPHMQGKPQHAFAEPMYENDTAVFLDRLSRGDHGLDSLRTGIENLRLTLGLMYPS